MKYILVALLALGAGPLLAEEILVDSVVLNLIAEAKVPADEAGAMVELAVQPGARVQRGDLLARIDDRDVLLELERAKIALEHAQEQAASDVKLRIAQKTLELTKAELKRAEDANRELKDVVSMTQMQKLKIDVERAELEVEQAMKDRAAAERAVKAARHEVQIAERAIERHRVVAPIEGVVAEVRRQPGEWLEPGETVLRLVRDDRLRAEGFVHVRQLAVPLLGAAAQLEVMLPGQGSVVFPGKVTFVSPEANPINGQVRIWAEIENAEHKLRAGLPARLLIQTPSATAEQAP
jgi:macrolide-specific efflux system membrane fusion protein